MNKTNQEARDFTVELTSSKHLTRLSANGGVLIEGTIGKLEHATFVDTEIFEVKGDCGILRLNLTKNEIKPVEGQE